MALKQLIKIILPAVLAAVVFSCAREMMPTGGKKDVKPPEIVQSVPPNGSANFTGNKFELKFNEFVVLDKINEQLLISPPVKENPDFRLKGKSLIVKFKNELKPNTTYSVYFGDAIVDLTEGNPIHSFTYLFSTGDHVDSLSMAGKVINAFDLKPADGVMVMLYRNDNDTIPFDSLPMRVPPYYLSKTDKQGNFQFSGLAGDNYLVFALKDLNNNYIFDQPSEEIAFSDTLVYPEYITPAKVDTTIATDSVAIEIDSAAQIISDSLLLDTLQKTGIITPLKLLLFKQYDTVQRLMEAKLIRLNTIRFIFSNPADNVSINAVNYPQRNVWHLTKWSAEHDTLWWFLQEPEITVDTLNILLTNRGDTLDNLFIPVKLREKKPNVRLRKNEKEKRRRKDLLTWQTNMRGGISPVTTLHITFDQPIETILTDSILFVAGEDSVYAPTFIPQDSLHMDFVLPVKLKEDTKYRLFLPDSCFIDLNGYFNKEKSLNFGVKPIKEYGTLTINLKPGEKGSYLFQLINGKEEVFRQTSFTADTTVYMEYLKPGNYLFKIIVDKNNNGKWDPGNYIKKLEPEPVTYFQKVINVRANWEIEETWQFKPDEMIPAPGKK
jgi:hypothetical protein